MGNLERCESFSFERLCEVAETVVASTKGAVSRHDILQITYNTEWK